MTRIPLLALVALLLSGPLSGPAGAQAPAAAQAPPAAQALPQPAARAEAQPAASQPGVSQPGASKSGASQPGADRTTTHSLALPGRTLDFAATVNTIRLANPAGAVQAEIVTTAFQLSGAAPGTRPVTFVVNGGPGASSAWLNLGAIGPWRVKLDGALPSTRPAAVDNMETWLDFTDLVFLDPPGTGFSRATGGDKARRGMQSVDGDIRTLASVIHRWLQAQGRLASPKFIAGESWVGRLPSLVAAARGAAGRAELRDAEDYAASDYLEDLVRGEHDAIATERLSRRVAELTGLDPALVRHRAGKLDLGAFLRDRDPGRVGSPYDATVTAADPFPSAANDNSPDPILDGLRGPLTGAMLDIYRNRLDWQPEGAPARQYFLLNDAIAREWDYGHSGNRPEALTELRQFLALDASARVLVAHGLTDLVTPYFASKLLLDQVPETAPPDRLQLRVYAGGHMFYSRDASRAALHEDAGALVGAALAAEGGAAPAR